MKEHVRRRWLRCKDKQAHEDRDKGEEVYSRKDTFALTEMAREDNVER